MKSILTMTAVLGIQSACWIAAAQDDVADIPSQRLEVKGSPNAVYFLIGPASEGKQPERGYKLLVVLPGGDGSESFHPFVKRIFKFALPDGYLVAQLVAFKWRPDQAIVWPTRNNPVPNMKFSTEDFIEAVVAEVGHRHKVNPQYVFTMGWSSGGAVLYAAALQRKTHITGSYIAMSVFNTKLLPPLASAKGRAFYIEHSADDQVCPFWMAQKAKTELAKAGGKVEFSQYEGGHGWQGDVYGRMRKAILWLEENTK